MKSIALPTLLALAGFSASASAQSLPPGNYTINGTVTSLNGSSCPVPANNAATGVLYYPGPGRDTLQIVLESVQLQKSVTVAFMDAFPAVPPNGLNGWSSSSPAGPNYNQYQNGQLVGGGTGAYLSFNLGQSIGNPLYFALGTMTLEVDSIAPCEETFQVILQKVSNFKQIPG